MSILFANNAKTTTTDNPLTSGATTINVADGSKFPSPTGGDYFYATLATIDESAHEIVRCSSRSGNILTVTRGQDGTTAVEWPYSTKIELRVTRGVLQELSNLAFDQTFSGTGAQTAFTTSSALYSEEATDVFISGVRQVPGTDYTISGTTLTFTSAPPVGTNNIYVRWTSPIATLNGVSGAMIADGSIVGTKIADGAVTFAKLNSALISAATEDTTPDLANDFLMSHDASASGLKKVKMQSIAPAPFPTGTLMLFQQTAAPTGWTKQTTHNDKALRVVSGTASSGGTTAFSSVMASRTPAGSVSVTAAGTVSNTTLTTAMTPQAVVQGYGNTTAGSDSGGPLAGVTFQNNQAYQAPAAWANTPNLRTNESGGSHNHTFTNSGSTGSFTGTAMDFAVQYVDIIIASKN